MRYDVPDDLAGLRCPKLILQPLVENALIHGIEKMERKGIIRLSGKVDRGAVVISISDNGAGADTAHLNAYLAGDNHSPGVAHGHGTRNVNRRIQLKFGEAYGLRYEPNEPRGVTAVIRLPIGQQMHQ
jgi:two-component system sensor histidine kinase YesM